MRSNINILIVEDELIIAMDLKKILEKKGYSVLKIEITGEEAVKTAATYNPDIILMDIHLKGKITGLEAAEQLIPCNIPIIFVTSQKDEATSIEMEKLSPYCIFKPYQENIILEKIEKILQSRFFNACSSI